MQERSGSAVLEVSAVDPVETGPRFAGAPHVVFGTRLAHCWLQSNKIGSSRRSERGCS
jgi:hypothetical protein